MRAGALVVIPDQEADAMATRRTLLKTAALAAASAGTGVVGGASSRAQQQVREIRMVEAGGLSGDSIEVGYIRPFTARTGDRKSTRLNSSHANISYAVFCLKKKKKT